MPKKTRAPTTPEEWEQRLTLKAHRLAEKQIDEGTVSSQVLTHYLQADKNKLDADAKRKDIEYKEAKIEAIRREEYSEEIINNAIDAMSAYRGQTDEEDI